ncbi:MAG: hypothetical protein BGO31_14260 [Bacteroidetes bacterium 43-16]|nr:MAG: hypothetical protein BGO31_14260 [Bacteroidetes bacterium 43-16]
MKTQIIIKKNWNVVASYDHLVTMSKGDMVKVSEDEADYFVEYLYLDTINNVMMIFIKPQ